MTANPPVHAAPRTPLRLRLKPEAPVTGFVDGAWWPRTHDLAAELVALAEVLAIRLGRIERVAYALSTWDTPPRRLVIDGFPVRIEGFTHQDKNIIHVTGTAHGRLSLLVIPPETTGTAARDALTTAAHRGNTDRPAEILAATIVPVPRQG